MENGTQMTLDQWMPDASPTPIAGASVSPVKTSPLQESNLGLLETARHSFSELCTWLDNSKKKKDPLTCSLRTLKICLVLMEDGISPGFSLKWTGAGTMRNGLFSTQSISASRKTGNAVLLSDILEEEVPQKYFLSKEQTERIVFTESDTVTDTEETSKSSIGGGITEARDTAAGGGRGQHSIEVIGKTRESKIIDRTRILSSGGINQCLRSTDYKDPTKVAIPVSFAKGEIKKEIDTAHCLSAEGPAKEGMRTHQSTTRVAIPVLTPDRAEKRQNGRRFKEDGEESFTLTAQDRHGVAVDVTGYNTTSKRGGITDTALTLMARDYKGLGNQMMTTAMMCLQSTKESLPKNEKSQTVLGQEKTVDSANITNKEH
jgi:hypothetical protein